MVGFEVHPTRREVSERTSSHRSGRSVAVYLDFANVWTKAINKGLHPSGNHVLELAKVFGNIVVARVYMAFVAGSKSSSEVLRLEREGFEIVSRYVPSTDFGLKKDIDAHLVADFLYDLFTIRPDIMVLVSDDSDFAPAMRRARAQGVRCISFVSNLKNASVIVGASTVSYELSLPIQRQSLEPARKEETVETTIR